MIRLFQHHIMVAWLLLWTSLLPPNNALTASRESPTKLTSSALFGNFKSHRTPITALRARLGARHQFHREGGDDGDMERQRSVERPTETFLEVLGPGVSPAKPKIVVLGATGKVGRLVVKQLLEMTSIDMTVVAFCRDYDKAIRVLYDDMVVAKQGSNKGPRLQIVEGDLVPPEELPGFCDDDSEDEQVWMDTAQSVSQFYGTNVQEYDNREMLPEINEALQDAIKDCTTVISCVGSVRATNVWTDFLARPFSRLLRPDVSTWCKDGRHPYYVHYVSTRKALGYAEREQLRREAAAMALAESEDLEVDELSVPRIRFVRISDLCVGHKPWHFVPLVTNVIQSVVFRYHEMAEQLLDQSTMVETVVLRPGDLVDEERDPNTAALQVSHTGIVPSPARVGRDDVASLAVAAAMFPTKKDSDVDDNGPFHYTLACRWVGQDMNPYPAQGLKADGLADAETALKRTLTTIRKAEQRSKQRKEALRQKDKESPSCAPDLIARMADQLKRQRKKLSPHGICVALPVYLFLGLFAKALMTALLQVVPGGKTWVLPALYRLNELALVGLSVLVRKAMMALQAMMALPWLPRRKQYISFF